MLFVNHTASVVAAKKYFDVQLVASDYFLRDVQELAGEWHGLGADVLGLSGAVEREQYFRLCDNLHPVTGERLTPRTKADRRILYDFTFDAPKSVSLAYEIGQDERILNIFRDAVQATMAEMEGAMMTRVRGGGADADRITSNWVWAEFVHRSSRPVDGLPDPQLHCHAVAFNCTYDTEEDRWKAGQFAGIIQDKGYYQAVFHSRFAKGLADIGYGIEKDGNSFRLAGIDRATCQKFSRRTAVIEAEAQRLGVTNAKAKGELGRRTRQAKELGGSIADLYKRWTARLTFTEHEQIVAARKNGQTRTRNAIGGMDYALSHCLERQSAVTEKELLKHALIPSVGNARAEEVQAELGRSVIHRRKVQGRWYVTTKEVHNEELYVVAFVRKGRGKFRALGGFRPAPLDEGLSAEQRKAGQVILRSRDGVTALIGAAGSGKTRLTRAVVTSIEKGGKRVFAFAPSAEASRGVLRAEGFADADTVERLLVDKELQSKVKGHVLWIDEAGLLSVKDMKRLFEVAKAQECRIVLAGDSRQHSSVARGDGLRILEQRSGIKSAELTEVKRQTNESYRQAVMAIRKGDQRGADGRTSLENGIEMLDRLGALVEIEGEDRHRRLAADYVSTMGEQRQGKQKSALVIAPTHLEGDLVTRSIRETLRACGHLSGVDREVLSLRNRSLTEAERSDASNFATGDVVQFHQNAKGFKRGERLTVTAVDQSGVYVSRDNSDTALLPLNESGRFQLYEPGVLAVAAGDKLRITQNGFARAKSGGPFTKPRLNNGAVYQVKGFTKAGDIQLTNGFVVPKEYGGLAHGYALTSHAAQGKTVDKVFIALGSESLAAANREQFYVSVSRGRESVKLYTDDKEAVKAAVRTSAARLSAIEMMQGQRPTGAKTGLLKRVFNIARVKRAYASLVGRGPEAPSRSITR